MKQEFFLLDELTLTESCFVPSLWNGAALSCPAGALEKIALRFHGEAVLK